MTILTGRILGTSSSRCYGGWVVSVAVHSLVVLIGILLVQSVERTSFPKAFQWDVALVNSAAATASSPAHTVETARAAISAPSPIASRTPTASQSTAKETRESVIEEQPQQPAPIEQPTVAPTPAPQSRTVSLEPAESTPPPPNENHAAQQIVASPQVLEPSTPPTPVHAPAELPRRNTEASIRTPIASSPGTEAVAQGSPISTATAGLHEADHRASAPESHVEQPEPTPRQLAAVPQPSSHATRSATRQEIGPGQNIQQRNEDPPSIPQTRIASVAQGQAASPSSATASQGKPDFGWLSEAISKRVEELKRYPAMARADRLEGRVVVRAVVQEDGHLADLEIAKSSGHETLDRAAMEVLQQAFPLPMVKALGKPRVTIHVPLSYRLDR